MFYIKHAGCLAAIFSCVLAASAGVYLDPARDAIVVRDYPPAAPCTLPRLAACDRAYGWGRVAYDAVAQTCAISGDLIIGANDGTETVLQVGSAERPQESLVMRGNLYVHPYFIQGENGEVYWKAPQRTNALFLGDRTNQSINASLLFACTPTDRWTLFCGRLPWQAGVLQWGGGLYVYNSRIAPLDPAPGCEIGDGREGVYLEGSTVLENARISGVKGMLYRMGPGVNKEFAVRNTVFDHVATPLAGAADRMENCTFRNCGTAVLDRGGLKTELTGCIFNNNERNWSLTYSGDGLTLVDCEWDAPRLGDIQRAYVKSDGTKNHPKLIVRRHVIVEVLDGGGRPVEQAEVSFRPQFDGCDLLRRRIKTGSAGRTPGRDAPAQALLLTDYMLTATDTPDRPERLDAIYTITAAGAGKCAAAENVRADRAWKTVTVTLK